MYTLKSIAKRGSMLGAAFAVFAAVVIPSASVFADALNPLTERSLLLTSSAPGFQDTDGSGNSEVFPNAIGQTYAPPGSGPNGKKSGNTFTFKVSTDSSTSPLIKGMSFQYCTTAAGFCQSPGNNQVAIGGDVDNSPTTNLANSDGDFRNGVYNGTTNTDGRPSNAFAHPLGYSDLEVVAPTAYAEGTNFDVYVDADGDDIIEAGDLSTGWVFETSNLEDPEHTKALTGKNNYITLSNSAGVDPEENTKIQVVFKATSTHYITNPGDDSFFVKINTYDTDVEADMIGTHNDATPLDVEDDLDHTVIDGGVTVANVMTDSIHITTKVLETMSFSVGTQNPDTQQVQHGICDPIDVVNNNRLNMGNPNAEFSLEIDTAYDVFSYWRLSSNSSGGATVYYSGNTLQNTVGDFIEPIGAAVGNGNDGAKAHSQTGTEQFGLALVDAGADTLDNNVGRPFPSSYVTPNIAPLTIESDYADGAGPISNNDSSTNAQFAFKKSSLTTPALIAQNDNQVLNCATSKIRYVANIAPSTPAGVYTTKINFLAAPQY
jgi:hypothetical protein